MKIVVGSTNFSVLLKTVDNLLKDKRNGVPENIKGQAVQIIISKLFSQNHFNVCAISEISKITGVSLSHEVKALYSAMHCIDYSNMTQDVREYLFATVVDTFRSNLIMSNANIGFNNSTISLLSKYYKLIKEIYDTILINKNK